VLTAQPGPTVTTFHGWFLDLLKRAPLEAGLPWGAPLLERTRQLQDEVRDRLLARWAAAPESPEGAALLALLAEIGEHNLRALLKHFAMPARNGGPTPRARPIRWRMRWNSCGRCCTPIWTAIRWRPSGPTN
jgi:hypothetical protein